MKIKEVFKEFGEILFSEFWWFALLVLPVLPFILLMVFIENLFGFKFEDYINTRER